MLSSYLLCVLCQLRTPLLGAGATHNAYKAYFIRRATILGMRSKPNGLNKKEKRALGLRCATE